jgi:hypothetical protein
MCIVLRPSTAGEALKVKLTVVSPFAKKTLSAGVPFTVKSLAPRVAGSTGSLTLRLKLVGGVVTIPPQPVVLTEQGAEVGVGVGVGVSIGADSVQYLPPVFRKPLRSAPPQTIISLPVQTAV